MELFHIQRLLDFCYEENARVYSCFVVHLHRALGLLKKLKHAEQVVKAIAKPTHNSNSSTDVVDRVHR